jgi:putative endonuclease
MGSRLRGNDDEVWGRRTVEKPGFVYIMASRRHGTLYTGVTSDLPARIAKHRDKSFKGFTAEFEVNRLVWFEDQADISAAIDREKRIKKWRREWKVNLIEAGNPE